MSYENEIAALRAAQEGDKKGFTWLVESCQRRIFSAIYARVRNGTVTKRLTEHTFLTAFQRLHSCRGDFFDWLYGIAMTITNDYLSQENDGLTEPDEVRELQSTQLESNSVVLEAIEKLPVQDREILKLREIDGKSYLEIAEVLGIHEGQIAARLYQVRKALQAVLQNDDE